MQDRITNYPSPSAGPFPRAATYDPPKLPYFNFPKTTKKNQEIRILGIEQAFSQERVFALPGITEAIFLLTFRDLLVNVQRVNKALHSTIETPHFQRPLFFESWNKDSFGSPSSARFSCKPFRMSVTYSTESD